MSAPFRCPTCRRPVAADAPHRPFCSDRCRLIDLGHWFDETYAVPGEDAIDMDGLGIRGLRGEERSSDDEHHE